MKTLAFCFLAACLAFSGSRMAWIYFILFWSLIFIEPKLMPTVTLGSIVFMVIRLMQIQGPDIHSGAVGQIMAGQDHRLLLWQHAMLMIYQNPVNGVGWGEFAYNMYQNSISIPIGFLDRNAHNILLHIGAELGLIGLAIFFWLLYVLTKRIAWKDMNILASGILAIQILHSMVEFPLHYAYILGLTGLVIGLKEKHD